MSPEWLRYVGRKVTCPICRWHFRSFAPDLWDGTRWHGEPVRCPRCGSRPRHRWLWLYLHAQPDLLDGKAVLHVAPEPMIAPYIEGIASEYVSTDIELGRARVRADLTALPFADAYFDTVICSHVLEHVPDDHAALGELHRVLRLGGVALIPDAGQLRPAGHLRRPGRGRRERAASTLLAGRPRSRLRRGSP